MTAIPPADDAGVPAVRRIRGSRRVVREGASGADPTPQERAGAVKATEDTDATWSARVPDSTDDQLRRDVPPHWG